MAVRFDFDFLAFILHPIYVMAQGRSILFPLSLVGLVGFLSAGESGFLSEVSEGSRISRLVRVPSPAEYTAPDYEHFVIRRGDADESLAVDETQDARMFRYQISAEAEKVGVSRILQWRGITVGLSYDGSFWRLLLKSPQSAGWTETEFVVSGDASLPWITLDLVRREIEAGDGEVLIFVDGAPVSAPIPLRGRGKNPSPRVFQSDFAEIRVSGLGASDDFPEFARRAWLRRDHTRRETLVEVDPEHGRGVEAHVLKQLEQARLPKTDAERKQLWRYGDFAPNLFPGDLNFSEQAWAPTRTLNRAVYAWEPSFDLANASRFEPYLTLVAADYLPTLESRGWSAPYAYENIGDRFIEKIYGYLLVSEPGEYRLEIETDEAAALYLLDENASSEGSTLRLAAEFIADSPRRDGRSAILELSPDFPVYFELWRVETDGPDRLAVNWLTRENDRLPISSFELSSFASGAPGDAFRRVGYADQSLLDQPAGMPSLASVLEENLNVSGNNILGNYAIQSTDFTNDADHWLVHASQGNGLGWLYHSGGVGWPNSIWSSTYNAYLNYTSSSVQPQLFWRTDIGMWFRYYYSPATTLTDAMGLPSFWDFESGMTNWVNFTGDDEDWTLDTGGTSSSGTGPTVDRTLGTAAGHYVYTEASSPYFYTAGETAVLGEPVVWVPAAGVSIAFAYHMYGADIGTLHFEVNDGSGYTSKWSRSGQQNLQNDLYNIATVDLSAYANKYIKVRFRAVAAGDQGGGGYRGDMALDDIALFENDRDSDGDGYLDGVELMNGSDPLDAGDALFSDADADWLSLEVETLISEVGANGELAPGTWPVNTALVTAIGSNLPALVLPGKGVWGVNATRQLVPVSY